MKSSDRLWPHIFLLCIGSCFVGCVLGTVIANDDKLQSWLSTWSGWAATVGALLAAALTVHFIRRQIALQALLHRRTTLANEQEWWMPRVNSLASVMVTCGHLQYQTKQIIDDPHQTQRVSFIRNLEGQNGLMRLQAAMENVSDPHRYNAHLVLKTTERLIDSAKAATDSSKAQEFSNECENAYEILPRVINSLMKDKKLLSDRLDVIKGEINQVDDQIASHE